MLLIANQQLALAGNVPAALAALQLADAKLARIDRPPLGAVAPRAVARHRSAESGAVRRRDRDHAEARPGDRSGRHAAAREGRAAAAAEAGARATGRAALAARACGRRARVACAGAPRGQRPAGGAARRARPGVLPAREPAAAPAVRAHGDPRPARGDATSRICAPRRRGCASISTRARNPCRRCSTTLAQMLATPMPDELPDLAASLDAVRTLKAAQERRTAQPVTPARPNR